MSLEEITSFLAEIVERVSGVPAARVTPESSFADLGIDSLSMLEIIVAAEDRFGVRINDDDVADLRTISDAAAYIQESEVAV